MSRGVEATPLQLEMLNLSSRDVRVVDEEGNEIALFLKSGSILFEQPTQLEGVFSMEDGRRVPYRSEAPKSSFTIVKESYDEFMRGLISRAVIVNRDDYTYEVNTYLKRRFYSEFIFTYDVPEESGTATVTELFLLG